MDLEFRIQKNISEKINNLEIIVRHIRPDWDSIDIPNNFLSIGIDPGTVNSGICIIEPFCTDIRLYEIRSPRERTAVERVLKAKMILDTVIRWGTENFINPHFFVEGSAFAMKYRQVELAEIRASYIDWAISKGFPKSNIRVISPSRIRKVLFGNGKIKAHEFWTNLSDLPDACAALSIALYPMFV